MYSLLQAGKKGDILCEDRRKRKEDGYEMDIKMRILIVMFCLAALCMPLLCTSCASSIDVSAACVGYAAGKKGELSFARKENEELILPASFTQSREEVTKRVESILPVLPELDKKLNEKIDG